MLMPDHQNSEQNDNIVACRPVTGQRLRNMQTPLLGNGSANNERC
jgi:hypothetical protein